MSGRGQGLINHLRGAGVVVRRVIPDLVAVLDVDVQVGKQTGVDRICLRGCVGVDAIAAVLEQVGQVGDVGVGGFGGDIDPEILVGLIGQLASVFPGPAGGVAGKRGTVRGAG